MALWEETMPGQSADNLLALFDAAPLNRRYWVTFVLLSALSSSNSSTFS